MDLRNGIFIQGESRRGLIVFKHVARRAHDVFKNMFNSVIFGTFSGTDANFA